MSINKDQGLEPFLRQISQVSDDLLVKRESSDDGYSTSERLSFVPIRSIGGLQFIVLAYFWVAGGFYGNERLIASAPPQTILLAFILMPILFALPLAIILAELGIAIPEDGGQTVAVTRAWGKAIGTQNAYWVLLTNFVDSATYPALFLTYLPLPDWPALRAGLTAAMPLLISVSHMRGGTEFVGHAATVAALLASLPCLIFCVIGLFHLKLDRFSASSWGSIDENCDDDAGNDDSGFSSNELPMLLALMIWVHTGWSSFGSVAGELKEPRRNILTAITVLLPLVAAQNIIPLAVAISLEPCRGSYLNVDGEFGVLAKRLGGEVFYGFFIIGAAVSLLGLHNGGLIAAQRVSHFLFDDAFPPPAPDNSALDGDIHGHAPIETSESNRPKVFARFMRYLLAAPPDGVRRVHVVLSGVVSAALSVFVPYWVLIQLEMSLYSVSMLFFFTAFIKLRITEPDLPRPFKVPGGLLGAVVIAFFPCAILLFNLVVALCGGWLIPELGGADDDSTPEWAEGSFKAVIAVTAILLGLAVSGVIHLKRKGDDS